MVIGKSLARAMDIKHFEVFLSVARLGNLRVAARQLDIPEWQVQGYLFALERSFGTRLAVRRERYFITLTPAGHRIFSYARQLIELCQANARGAISPCEVSGTAIRRTDRGTRAQSSWDA